MCYMGHRRYLPANHPDRRKKKAFDGTEEGDMAPLPLSGEQILQQVQLVDFKLCGKELELDKLDALHEHVVKTLCNLEKFFPPSFFDIMIHLMVHLVREARLCGPVWARWMYPFERNMKVLKSYVRNHYRPEACMVECYISEEAVEFCSEYMAGVETIGLAYKNWKEVNQTLKNKVWKDIQTGFIVPDTFKHDCLILAGKLMKDFKNRMTKDIIMPALKENDLGRLAQVPEKHPEIDAADWCKFVESRLTPEFLELSKVQRERSSKIQSRHRSGRSGMVNVREAVKKDLEVADPPRHRVWIKSRTKSRKLVTDYDKEIAEKIVSIY
ncbi:hypothetical protein CsatA_015232 [Cannabis sativa]